MSTANAPLGAEHAISATTPSFVVGPDGAGHWLAVETHGLGGGMFVSRDAALGYARSESCHRPGGVALTSAPIALR